MTNNPIACFDMPSPAPEWIRVAPYGSWRHLKVGKFSLDRAQAEQMVTNHEQLGIDIVVDFEHQTLTGAKAPAAGWIKQLEARDDGLWARVEWTDEARSMIEAKQYRYYSPVFDFAARDAHSGKRLGAALHSLALTNTPLLARDILPLAAKQTDVDLLFLSAPAPRREAPTNERSVDMSLTELAQLLGLSDDATEEQIRAKLKELADARSQLQAEIQRLEADAPVAAKSILDELGLPELATEAEVRGKLIALKRPQGYVSREEFDALERQLAERDAADLVDAAIAACKVTPAQSDWAAAYARRDPKGFAAFVESAPTLIDAKATRPSGARGGLALTDEERLVCDQLGLTPAQFAACGR